LSSGTKRLRVSLFLRKPRAGEHYSIERLFDAVIAALPEDRYEVKRLVCPFQSQGLIRRSLNVLWAIFNQGDVNHVTGDVNYLGLLMHRSRTVLTIHDSASMSRLSGLKRWVYSWIWLRLPIRRAAIVTVISDSSLYEILEYTREGSSNFRVIPNCVTSGMVGSAKSFNSVRPRVLQIGTKENKNLVRVIDALKGMPCQLAIVGRLSTEQKQVLKDSGLMYENHTGLDMAAMAEQYRRADMVVFVSTYEGFGLPILEAQAVGRAVVTSARAPMNIVAGDGAALVNPENVAEIREAIGKIIADESYREELIAAGLENVKEYSPEKIATQYAAVYEELFRDGRSR